MATPEDKCFHQAVRVEGQRKAAAARKAFREAAEEPGILIGDDRRPAPKPMKRTR